MKRVLFLVPFLFFLTMHSQASAGQWYTKICPPIGFEAIPGASLKNITESEQGLPSGARGLECGYRSGYPIGGYFKNRFFGIVQTGKMQNNSSLVWEWEELPEATLFALPQFIPGKIYLRAQGGTRACLWAKTEFFENYSWSCVTKSGVRSQSRFGALLRPSHSIKVKKNRRGKIISRSGYFDIVPGNLGKINAEVFGDDFYNITVALGLECKTKGGCQAKGKPQMTWRQINFLNKENEAPFLNPDGYVAIEFPETVPDANPLVVVAKNNDHSLAGEIKCPLKEEDLCIDSYGSQMIGGTDLPLDQSGAGIRSLRLKNNRTGSESGSFLPVTLNGNNKGWSVASDGMSLFERCQTSGFYSTCLAPPWGILQFEMRSEINTSYNLNGANRLQVCAYDRKELLDGGDTDGLEACVVANDSFILDNEGASGSITLPEEGSSLSGEIDFAATAQDTALGVASVQFFLQKTNFLGEPEGEPFPVSSPINTFTPPGQEGTYQATVDSTTIENGSYLVVAEIKDKAARELGSSEMLSYTTEVTSDWEISIENE